MTGERLKQARIDAHLTQTKLADLVGVKPAEISQYESSKRTPRWNTFIKILDILNVSADYILGREVEVVSDNDEYHIRLAKKDLEIIKSIKDYPKLYRVLSNDPDRNTKVINNNLKQVFPE